MRMLTAIKFATCTFDGCGATSYIDDEDEDADRRSIIVQHGENPETRRVFHSSELLWVKQGDNLVVASAKPITDWIKSVHEHERAGADVSP